MTNWHGMMLLVSEWSLKSPLHSATIASVLCALAGSLFHKFSFFMEGPLIFVFIRRNKYKFISHFVLNTIHQIYVHTLSIPNKKGYLALEVSAYYENIAKLVTTSVITQAPLQILLGEYLIIILLAISV